MAEGNTGRLWKGRVREAIEIMKQLLPRCRVRGRVEELINYLVRKRSWIGDYAGRRRRVYWIASTRVEKWNDVAVSGRCKHRGMSWTESGVLAMALGAGNPSEPLPKPPKLTRKITPASERKEKLEGKQKNSKSTVLRTKNGPRGFLSEATKAPKPRGLSLTLQSNFFAESNISHHPYRLRYNV